MPCALPASEHSAFLAAECGADETLRRAVESLLAQPERALATVGISEPHASMIGHRIGPYHLLALLGAGGMGEVYRARDTKLGREVALKILPRAFSADPDRLARFPREARILASLNHPNIATVYGIEDANGVHAIAMELVEGRTLADAVSAAQGLPIPQVLAIARQIADALDAAHERGIVHRDLKPANVILTHDGVVKVLDFGLARMIAPAQADDETPSKAPTITSDRTCEGLVMGTAAYMSPEQARGKPVDKRTDIWAFGCVLYEMLSGRRAFERDNVYETLAAVLEREPDWRVLPAGTPPDISRLVRQCLEKDPKRRLRDIGDVAMVFGGRVTEPSPSPSLNPVRAWNGWVAVAAALIAGAALGAMATWLGRTRSSVSIESFTASTIASQLTNYGRSEGSPALSPDGRTFAFVSDHGGTPDIWVRQISGGDPLRLTTDEAVEADLAYAPDGEWIYFTRTLAGRAEVWRIGGLGGQAQKVLGDARMPVPSPDGRSLLFYTTDSQGQGFQLNVSSLDGGDKRPLVTGIVGGVLATRPAWSPDSRRVSFSRGGLFVPTNLFVADLSTGETRQVTRFTRANEGGGPHAWLPDNRHLVISYVPSARQQAPNDLGVLDSADGSIHRLTIELAGGLGSPSLSADGSRLIAVAVEWEREVWKVPFGLDPDANGRTAVRVLDGSGEPMWTFVSRDGGTLLFNSRMSGSRNLWMMPLAGSHRPRQLTTVPGDSISHSSLSPDGHRLAFASISGGSSRVWTQNVDGTDLRPLTDATGAAWPVWSPDGEWILYSSVRTDGAQETWRVPAAGGAAEKIIDGFFRGDWVSQPSGSGSWVVSSIGGSGGVRLLDFERRKVLWEERFPDSTHLPMFSSDRTMISLPFPEGRDHDAIRVYDAASGKSRVAARLPFHVLFRADWVDDDKAFIVNRSDPLTHIVLLDRFWSGNTTLP